MSIATPIPRQTRQSIVTALAAQVNFGPFDFPLFDQDDLQVRVKAVADDEWTLLASEDYAVHIAPPAVAYPALFSITLVEGRAAGDLVWTKGARLPSRVSNVTRAGKIQSQPLESEFDVQAATQQELRRDIDALISGGAEYELIASGIANDSPAPGGTVADALVAIIDRLIASSITNDSIVEGDTVKDALDALSLRGTKFLPVPDRGVLASVDTANSDIAFVFNEPGRNGIFVKNLYANYSPDVATDPLQGWTVRSTFDDTFVWVRLRTDDIFMIDWWRSPGATVAEDTAAVKAAVEAVPSGGTASFTFLQDYYLNPVSAAPRGHIKIKGNGATIINTSQVAALGVPIFRINPGSQNYDVEIDGLNVRGPRLTSDTTVGTGSYGGDPLNPGVGYPSGIDIPIARNVRITRCTSKGTFFSGIEVHYAKDVLVQDNRDVSNHGFAGVLISDCIVQRVINNDVDDIGSVAPTNGYGITVSTSYNTPGYTNGNKEYLIEGNRVSRCKRKGIDVHDGLHGVVVKNIVKACAYGHIYATCEGSDKQVADIIVGNNLCYGDASFGDGTTQDAPIVVGLFGNPSQNINAIVHHNHLGDIVGPNGIFLSNNDTAGKNGVALKVHGNTMANCAFSDSAIRSNNWSQKLKMLSVDGNIIQANVGTAHIYLNTITDAASTNNICQGTTPASAVTVQSNVTSIFSMGNKLNGAHDPWIVSATLTLPAYTLSGDISGAGKKLDNIIIGSVTPLAASFTTLNASGDFKVNTTKFTVAAATGNMTAQGDTNSFGTGGTGTTPTRCYFNGGSGAGGGSFFAFQKNGATGWYFGVSSAVSGSGTSDDFLVFNNIGSPAAAISVSSANSQVTFGAAIKLAAFTVATLPAGSAGMTVFCSNVRVFNGAGVQEGAGVGTGGTVIHNGTAWKIAGTNVTAVA